MARTGVKTVAIPAAAEQRIARKKYVDEFVGLWFI
jgi:hypothetical protein